MVKITDEMIIRWLETHPALTTVFISIFFMIIFYIGTPDKETFERREIFRKMFLSMLAFSIGIIGISFLLATQKLQSSYGLYISIGAALSTLGVLILSKVKSPSKKGNPFKVYAQQQCLHPITRSVDIEAKRKSLQDSKKINHFRIAFGDNLKRKEVSVPAFPIKPNIRQKIKNEKQWLKIKKGYNNILHEKEISPFVINGIVEKAEELKNDYLKELTPTHLGVINLIDIIYGKIAETEEIYKYRKKVKQIKESISKKPMKRFILEKFLFDVYKRVSVPKIITNEWDEKVETKTFIYPITNLYLLAKTQKENDFLGALQMVTNSKIQPFGCSYYFILESKDYIQKVKEEEKILEERLNKNKNKNELNGDLNSGSSEEQKLLVEKFEEKNQESINLKKSKK